VSAFALAMDMDNGEIGWIEADPGNDAVFARLVRRLEEPRAAWCAQPAVEQGPNPSRNPTRPMARQ